MGFAIALVLALMCMTVGIVARPKVMSIELLKNSARSMVKPLVFETRMAERDVLKRIVQFAQESKYDIEDFDLKEQYIILSQPAAWYGLRLYYPIFFGKSADSFGLTIEVCCLHNLSLAADRIAQQYHEDHRRCFNGIRAAMLVS